VSEESKMRVRLSFKAEERVNNGSNLDPLLLSHPKNK
jgi:hypothetical protein